MATTESNVLKAHYVFYSSATGNTYVLSLTTQPLTSNIHTLDNPNCTGYPIINGTFTQVSSGGTTNNYPVPGGKTIFIYNGLWPNAAESQGGSGSPLCQGIGQLFISFTQQSNNTGISANDSTSITVTFSSGNNDTALLLHAHFPPTFV